ncbi:hypothetical protein V5799_026610 [Amblyomma americanum]|uniref:Uncharacterized protein n=1 Tax=Amblyomma americanum TaxID=6943 RepID=A0AAQ4DI33_AMBAM
MGTVISRDASFTSNPIQAPLPVLLRRPQRFRDFFQRFFASFYLLFREFTFSSLWRQACCACCTRPEPSLVEVLEDYADNSNNDILENMFRETIASCILPLSRCILHHEDKQLASEDLE